MFRTIAHSFMVHVIVLEAYIQTDHSFPVLPIEDLINEDGEPTPLFTLATGKKPPVSNLRMLFSHVLYVKILHTLTKRR